MALPKRKKTEKKADFMSRCMADKTMMNDFLDKKQREDVCTKQCNMVEGGIFEEKIDALDALIEKANEVMGKTLTTKDRKALKSHVFCGPGRTYPCNDCVHVRVAKSYLNKSKLSESSKAKIAACINKREKILKCGTTKKDKASKGVSLKFADLSVEEKQLYASDVFKSTKELVESSIINPNLNAEDYVCGNCI